MKLLVAVIGILLCISANALLADSPAPARPSVVKAESGVCEFAMLLRDRNNKPRPIPPHTQSGVYRTGSVEPEWTVDWYAHAVSLLDCEKLIRYGPWASSVEDLAIAFYDQGEELMSYLIEDLVTDKKALSYSTSHFRWRFAAHLDVKNRTYQIDTMDGHRYLFSTDSGEIIKYEPVVYSDVKKLKEILHVYPQALQYATKKLRNDKAFISSMLFWRAWIICYAGDTIKSDAGLALTALSNKGRVLACFDDSIKLNKKFVLHALRANSGLDLAEIDARFHADEEVVKLAINNSSRNYKLIQSDLINDPKIIALAIKNGYWVPLYSTDQHIKNNASYVISTLEQMASNVEKQMEVFGYCADIASQSYNKRNCERFGNGILNDLRYITPRHLTNKQVVVQLDKTLRSAVLGDEARFKIEKESLIQDILKSAGK